MDNLRNAIQCRLLEEGPSRLQAGDPVSRWEGRPVSSRGDVSGQSSRETRAGLAEAVPPGPDPSSLPPNHSRDFVARLLPEQARQRMAEIVLLKDAALAPCWRCGLAHHTRGLPLGLAARVPGATASCSQQAIPQPAQAVVHQIPSAIKASAEAENTFYEDIQYVQVPVASAPVSGLWASWAPWRSAPRAWRRRRAAPRRAALLSLLGASGGTGQRPAVTSSPAMARPLGVQAVWQEHRAHDQLAAGKDSRHL